MKRLFALIALLILSVQVFAQDTYNVLFFQNNTLCPLAITLTASGPLDYQLDFDVNSIVAQGHLNAGDTASMALPVVDGQWYRLVLEYPEGGGNSYSVESADLQKMKDIRRNYKMKVRGLTTPLKPGDLVKVLYTGLILQDDGSIWPEGTINEDLYVNRVEEYAGEGGTWQNVDLSNVNSQKVDEATDVAIAVERSKKV